MIDGTMCFGSSTSMHVRIRERAINKLRTSPMTGIIPMIADQPNRNPQQQHVNDRSTSTSNAYGEYPFDMHVFEPF